MKAIKCMMIDDDKNSRQVIKAMLAPEFPMLEFELEAGNLKDAVALCDAEKPHLVFLDIHLGDGTGFDFLELTSHKTFKIIFTTGHNEFAVQAFKVNAVDYVMKPISKRELVEAVNKSLQFQEQTNNNDALDKVKHILFGNTQRLILPTKHGYDFFNIEDLIRCEADGNYTRFFFKSAPVQFAARTLGAFENLLESHGFCRIHASHMVNLREIKSFHRGTGGSVVMSDGTEVEVSKSKKDVLLSKLQVLIN